MHTLYLTSPTTTSTTSNNALSRKFCLENKKKKSFSYFQKKWTRDTFFREWNNQSEEERPGGKKRVWLSNLQKQKEREREKRMKWKLKDLVWRKLLWRRLRQRGRWVLHANFFLSFSLSFSPPFRPDFFLSSFLFAFSSSFTLNFFRTPHSYLLQKNIKLVDMGWERERDKSGIFVAGRN